MGFSNPGTFKDCNTAEVERHLEKGNSPVPVSAYAKHWQTFTEKKSLGITVKSIVHDHYDEGHSFVAERMMVRERMKTPPTDGRVTGTSKEEQYLVKVNWGWDNYHKGYYFNAAFDSNQTPIYTRSGTSRTYRRVM